MYITGLRTSNNNITFRAVDSQLLAKAIEENKETVQATIDSIDPKDKFVQKAKKVALENCESCRGSRLFSCTKLSDRPRAKTAAAKQAYENTMNKLQERQSEKFFTKVVGECEEVFDKDISVLERQINSLKQRISKLNASLTHKISNRDELILLEARTNIEQEAEILKQRLDYFHQTKA